MGELIIANVALSIVWAVALFSMSLIWRHLSKKPLGMQTCLDNLVKDVMLSSAPVIFTAWLMNSDMDLGWTSYLAKSVIICNYWFTCLHFTLVLWTIVVRYCNIFHLGVVTENWNDDQIVQLARSTSLAYATLAATYETTANGYGEGPVYESMMKVENPTQIRRNFWTLQVLMISVLVSAFYVQAKVEWYKMREPVVLEVVEQNNDRVERGGVNVQDDLPTIRVANLLILVIVMLIMAWIFVTVLVGAKDAKIGRLRIHVVTTSFMYNLVPLFMIKNTPQINSYLTSKFNLKKFFARND